MPNIWVNVASEYGEKLRKPFWSLIKKKFISRLSVQLEKEHLYWRKWTWNEKSRQEPDLFVAEWGPAPAHLWLLRTLRLFALVNYITQDGSKNTASWDGTWSYCSREIHLIIDQELLRVKIYIVWSNHKSNIATFSMNLSKWICNDKQHPCYHMTSKDSKKQHRNCMDYIFKMLLWCYLSFWSLKTLPLDWKELPRYLLQKCTPFAFHINKSVMRVWNCHFWVICLFKKYFKMTLKKSIPYSQKDVHSNSKI